MLPPLRMNIEHRAEFFSEYGQPLWFHHGSPSLLQRPWGRTNFRSLWHKSTPRPKRDCPIQFYIHDTRVPWIQPQI